MSSRRAGYWITFAVVVLFYAAVEVVPFINGESTLVPVDQYWPAAALTVFKFNLFIPLVGGILAADRLVRDRRIGIQELQASTPMRRSTALLAKYFGVLASMLLPVGVCVVITALIPIAGGTAGWSYAGCMLVTSIAINLPAMAFVVAFSLICPLVIPTRVYQVLFTGYWFWGNFLSPEVFPTISGTILNASGTYALGGLFSGAVDPDITYASWQAVLSITAILSLTFAILLVGDRYLAYRSRKA